MTPEQLRLGIEDLEQSIAAKEAEQDAANAGGDKSRRRPDAKPARNHGALPANLPRYEVLIDVEHRAGDEGFLACRPIDLCAGFNVWWRMSSG